MNEIGRFQVRRMGDGPNHILGIHGWGGGIDTFEPLRDLVPESVSFWSVALPGYNESPRLSEWRYERFIERAGEFLDAFPPKTFHLFGNCSGAVYGMVIAKQDPSRVSRMSLIDPFAYFPWYFKLLTAGTAGEFFYKSAFANPIGRYLTQRSVEKGRGDTADMTESFGRMDHEVVYAYLAMMRQMPGYRYFEDLQVPTELLIGERTFDAVKKSVPMWSEIFETLDVCHLDAAHLPIQEATEALAGRLWGS